MANAMRWDRRSVMKASGLGAMAALTQSVAWVRAAETSAVNRWRDGPCQNYCACGAQHWPVLVDERGPASAVGMTSIATAAMEEH